MDVPENADVRRGGRRKSPPTQDVSPNLARRIQHVSLSGSRGKRAMATADQMRPPKLNPDSPIPPRNDDPARPRKFTRSESHPEFTYDNGITSSQALGHIAPSPKRLSLRVGDLSEISGPPPVVPPSMKRINEFRLALDQVVAAQAILRTYRARKLYAQLLRNEEQRYQVARELLTTERTYAEGLADLQRGFLEPLTALESILPELSKLTAEVQVIRSYSSVVLAALESRLEEWTFTAQLGDLFLQVADFMKAYTQYIQTYNKLRRSLTTNRQSTQLSGLLDACAASVGNKTIGSFLIMPVQRLPRYEMLLKDILKHTWVDHPDYEDLQQAVGIINGIATFVNERKREEENFSKMADVQRRMVGKKTPDLVQPHRKWMKEGELLELEQGGKEVERYLFLFTDMLLCANQKGQVNFKKLAQTIRYNNQWCLDVEDLKVDLHADGVTFRMMSLGELRMLRAASPEERDAWLSAIAQVKRIIVEKKQALQDIPQ
mmetsp:Transcript_8088/g.34037  ORF Transcript_8088/g.34037 Transcript_8088/m.34037 type:complete len:491 (-) Transcript_8088:82-1554(-)